MTRSELAHHYLPGLDGLRALAITLVLFQHTGHAGLAFGQAGVELFFVLSGFLITRILLVEARAQHRISLRRFYIRRFLRLYPALLLAVLVFWPFRHDMFNQAYQSFGHWVKVSLVSLFYVANLPDFFFRDHDRWMGPFTSFWTLSLEEQFYVFWPCTLILLLALGRQRLRLVLAGLGLLIAASLAVMWYFTEPVRGAQTILNWQLSLPFRAWMLLLGCALGVLVTSGCLDHLAGHPAWSAVGLAGLGLLAWSCARYTVPRHPGAEFLSGFYRHRTILVTVASLAMIAAIVLAEHRLFARMLAVLPLVGLGKISYGLYVYHTMIFTIIGVKFLPDYLAWWVAVVQVVCSLAFAAVAYLLWERPFLRLKSSRRFQALTSVRKHSPESSTAQRGA